MLNDDEQQRWREIQQRLTAPDPTSAGPEHTPPQPSPSRTTEHFTIVALVGAAFTLLGILSGVPILVLLGICHALAGLVLRTQASLADHSARPADNDRTET